MRSPFVVDKERKDDKRTGCPCSFVYGSQRGQSKPCPSKQTWTTKRHGGQAPWKTLWVGCREVVTAVTAMVTTAPVPSCPVSMVMDDGLPGSADQAMCAIRLGQETFRHCLYLLGYLDGARNVTELIILPKVVLTVKLTNCKARERKRKDYNTVGYSRQNGEGRFGHKDLAG